jgi:hypothetical protein
MFIKQVEFHEMEKIGEDRGSPAKYKKEKAGQPESSAKALELVVWESQAISCVQIGTARHSP